MYKNAIWVLSAALLVALAGSASGQLGPEGWWSETIAVASDPAGSATIAGDTYTITGDGHDIWDAADDFHYLYKELVGDGSMTCRVVSIGAGSNTWAKGGVMIRDNNTRGSADAYCVMTSNSDGTAGNGAGFQWRETQGAGAAWDGSGAATAVAPPHWVRLVREGDTFSGFHSDDGNSWTELPNPHTVVMGDPVLIGLCVTSHAAGELRTFVFDNVSWTGDVRDRAPQLQAWEPDPADGAGGVLTPLFQWTPGETAVFHNVYFGDSPDLTEANKVASMQPFALYYHVQPLVAGNTYYWRVDEVEPDMVTVHTGEVWSFTVTPLNAWGPSPADGAEGVFPAATLKWGAGQNAIQHQVYFSDKRADVADGAAAADQGIVDVTEWTAPVLRSSTTYYWRVDGIAPGGAVTEGEVWSFTTDAGVTGAVVRQVWENIGGDPVSALTSSPDFPNNPTFQELVDLFEGPVDWADNYGNRFYGWLKPPQTGEYTFWIAGDNEQQLWLSTDEDPANAVQIANVPGWTPARDFDNTGGGTGDAAAQESDPISLVAGNKYYIEALGKEGGGGDSTAVAWQVPGGVREVIPGEFVDTFAFPPLQAFSPNPADGAVGVIQDTMLEWAAGERAEQHDVYFGDDEAAVGGGDPAVYRGQQAGTTYNPGPLEWGKTYYWRIDELNAGDPESPWPGKVWSFTAADFIPVEDFETYDDDIDGGTTIFQTWIDGYENFTGSLVGHLEAINGTFSETSVVYHGAASMRMEYNNAETPFYSETDRTWPVPQDWTVGGVTDLVMYVQGYPAATSVDLSPTGGAMTVTGDGADIWGNSDEFTYAYRTLNGDGTMVARVVSIGPGSNTWAKGGVMIRESLNGGSTHAMMVLTANSDGAAGNGASFQYRATTDGGSANNDSISVIAPPYWVKIERMGDTLSGYVSPDGSFWSTLGSTIIAMEDPIHIGICVTSHAAGEDRTFEFDNISSTGGVSGQWQGAIIDAPLHNATQTLYVAVQDSAGRIGVVPHPDPAAVNLTEWTEWRIPLSEFAAANVNLNAIKKMFIGVGDRDNPQPDGVGLIFVDYIRVMRPEAAEPVE